MFGLKIRGRWTRWGIFALLSVLVGCAVGCRSVRYYTQAVRGQVDLWKRQEKIVDLIQSSKTPERLRKKLEFILQLRTFAEAELGLEVGDNYLSYIPLDGAYVVWNVYAAPEFSTEGKKWWYPIIGKQSYQGYFKKESANQYAEQLRQEGYDAYVGGVIAYSTLGWFADPVLSSFVFEDDPELAGTIFHELTHKKFYVGGDTEFNEAYATVVEEEGVRRWFQAAGNQTAFESYLKTREREQQFLGLVLEGREQLSQLYQKFEKEDREGKGRSREAMREAKQATLTALRERYQEIKETWGGESRYDAWMNLPLNNAQLNTIALYHRWEKALRVILDQYNGDLIRFHEEIISLGKMTQQDREQHLEVRMEESLTRENVIFLGAESGFSDVFDKEPETGGR